ncbi:hypothetical protein SAMN04489807_2034 [Microbacterium hydrocarbonoxydans]|uniref:Uncharacterized protein n=1 Tax=Microbacterium hydrocarbonoxydans TaxID=273678 RepID=A0A1H4M7G1_9MICO|nr:hypothetical protein SAMN04489807_2034 [Microbacterium hydrocarbonoxydans]
MNDSIFAVLPSLQVGPADLTLPPTQPIDITVLMLEEKES